MKRNCETCAFWGTEVDDDGQVSYYGNCHYGPPMNPLSSDSYDRFPRSTKDDWCGKWAPIEED